MATNQDLNPSAISVSVENLSVVAYQNAPVITTELLAQLYGTEPVRIQQNHARNLDRFTEGKHFFKLTGAELKKFVTSSKIVANASKVRNLILWTERGAARHAKMLDTDQAWDVFEKLEDSYFGQTQAVPQISRITISPEQKAALHAIVDRRVNGFDSLRAGVWKRHNRHFNINSYHELLAARFEDATAYLETLEVKYPQVKADEAPKALPSPECESALKLIESIKAAPVIAGLVDYRITRKALGGLIDCLELHQPSSQVEPALAVLKAVDQLMMRQHTVITECEFLAGGQGKACHPTTMNNLRRTLKLGTSLSVSVLH